jgi:hypothetical protein
MWNKIIKDCLTEDDNETWDLDAIVWLAGMLILFGETIYHSVAFNAVEYVAALGAGYAVKKYLQIYQKKKGKAHV